MNANALQEQSVPSELELTLSPHELFALPACTPATGPAIRAEVITKGCPSFFALARLVKGHPYKDNTVSDHYRVFFRDEGRGHDEIFCGGGGGTVVAKGSLFTEEMRQQEIGNPCLVPTTHFWKAADLPYGIALHSNGGGQLIERAGRYVSENDFWWCSNEEQEREQFFRWNTQEFHAFCRQLTIDPDSELYFFLKWKTFSPEERTAYVTKCENGEWRQLVEIIKKSLLLIIYNFGSRSSEEKQDPQLKWKVLAYSPRHQVARWEWMRECYSPGLPVAYFYASRLREAIFKIIRPCFWPQPQPLCCYQWPNEDYAVTCKTPTLHEVLEAQLHLRDFLRPHLSASEIDALLIP